MLQPVLMFQEHHQDLQVFIFDIAFHFSFLVILLMKEVVVVTCINAGISPRPSYKHIPKVILQPYRFLFFILFKTLSLYTALDNVLNISHLCGVGLTIKGRKHNFLYIILSFIWWRTFVVFCNNAVSQCTKIMLRYFCCVKPGIDLVASERC